MKHQAQVIQRHKHTVTFSLEDAKAALLEDAKNQYQIRGAYGDTVHMQLPGEDDEYPSITITFDSI